MWTIEAPVVEAFPLYGQMVTATSETGWTATGVLVQMTGDRWATVEADGRTYALRAVRIEAA